MLAAILAATSLPLFNTSVSAQTAEDDSSLSSSAYDDGSGASLAPTMAVRLGFGGLAKVGDWLPVTIQVSNDGKSVTGELQVAIDDSSNPNRGRTLNFRPPVTYTVDANLPSHSRKQFEVDVFLPYPAKQLTAKLVTDQGLLVQQTGQLQGLSGSDVLCGTLSRNQDFFQQLKNLDLPGRQGKKPYIVALKPEDLPSRQHAMSSLDCLIVNNQSLTGLSDDQKNAVEGWVENGGLLVLGGGSGWQKTLQPLPKELLPVDVSGVKSVPGLQSLADFGHAPFKGDGPWIVSTGKLQSGTVVAQESGIPLLVGAKRGNGTVVYLATDPTAEPLNTWSGNATLWKYIMAYNTTPLAVFPFFGGFGGFATIQNWGQPPRTAIFNISGVDPPSPRWLIIFVGLYAFVLGPVNYLALRLAGAKALGWLTIPLLVAGGGFLTYRYAQQYRGSDLILNKISLVRSDGNSVEANVRSYVSLFSPRKGDFNVTVPGTASVTSYSRPATLPSTTPDNNSNTWDLKVTEGDTTNQVAMPLETSNTGSMLIDSQVRLPGKFDSSLQVNNDTIAGSLVNHTGETVDDVLLAIGSDVYSIGQMGNGAKKDVSFAFSPNACSTSPDSSKVKAALAAGPKGQDTNREGILDSFLGSNASTQSAGLSGLTLIGWLEKSPLPVTIDGLNPSVKETNLYVSSLPFQFPRSGDVNIPAALVETKQIGTFSTNFQRACQYELNPAGSLALEFTLPDQAGSMSSHNLVLHMDGHYAGTPRAPRPATPGDPLGQIFLYNWQSSDWDAQDFAWGNNSISDPTPYLSATNTLRLRYTYKAPTQQPTASLQFSLDLTDEGPLR